MTSKIDQIIDGHFKNVKKEDLEWEYHNYQKKLHKRRYEAYARSDAWDIIRKYFDQRMPIDRQVASYDWFLDQLCSLQIPPIEYIQIPKQNERNYMSGLRILHVISFGSIHMTPPRIPTDNPNDVKFSQANFYSELLDNQHYERITPTGARERKKTYQSDVLIDITYSVIHEKNGDKKIVSQKKAIQHPFCAIPVMYKSKICSTNIRNETPTNSGECQYEDGGVFIIGGNIRNLYAQEEMVENTALVFIKKTGAGNKRLIVCDMRCQQTIRNCADMIVSNPVLILLKYKIWKGMQKETICLKTPYNSFNFPVTLIFHCLGVTDEEDIYNMVCKDEKEEARQEMREWFKHSVIEGNVFIQSEGSAEKHIFKKFKIFESPAGEDDLEETDPANIDPDTIVPEVDLNGTGQPKRNADQTARLKFQNFFNLHLFPHIGTTPDSYWKKALFLADAVYKLLLVAMGKREEDNRDHYTNKRVKQAGPLIWDIVRKNFRLCFREMKRHLKHMVEKDQEVTMDKLLRIKAAQKIQTPFATGNWTYSKNQPAKSGVSNITMRMSKTSTSAYLSRSNTPIGKEGKQSKPRELESVQYQRNDPVSTPEGQGCGLIKESVLWCYMTLNNSAETAEELCYEHGTIPIESTTKENWRHEYRVVINGNWIGCHRKPNEFVQTLRNIRRQCTEGLNFETEIVLDIFTKCIRINTDGGRLLRPLLIVEKTEFGNQIKLTKKRINEMLGLDPSGQRWSETFMHLVKDGLIEFIGIEEEEYNCLVAVFPENIQDEVAKDYTHCEVHPSTMFGALVSEIPFSDHNYSVRNGFQGSHGKAAIAIPATNVKNSWDTTIYVLHYPQRSLASTKYSSIMKFNHLPSTFESIISVFADPFTPEDAITLGSQSIDLGMARISVYKTYNDSTKQINGVKEVFKKGDPKHTSGLNGHIKLNYVQEDGLPETGQYVPGGEVLIAKVFPTQDNHKGQQFIERDISGANRNKDGSVIEKVCIMNNIDGTRSAKVMTRRDNIPQEGDKFSTRHGQKGVAGNLCRWEDSEWTADGIYADYKMGPHAVPSRMTIAMIFEMAAAKYAALAGIFDFDATVYESSVDYCDVKLEALEKFIQQKTNKIATMIEQFKKDYNLKSFFSNDDILHFRQITHDRCFRFGQKLKNMFPEYKNKTFDVDLLGSSHVPKEILAEIAFLQLQSIKEDKLRKIQKHQLRLKELINIQKFIRYSLGFDEADYKTEENIIQRRKNANFYVWKVERLLREKEKDPKTPPEEIAEILLEYKKACLDLTELNKEYRLRMKKTLHPRLAEKLHTMGAHWSGSEIMYSGITGEKIETEIFLGPCSNQVLRHLVRYKEHARAEGHRYIKTGQPVEGRAKNGAFRLGEMESWCYLTNGTVISFRDKNLLQSDASYIYVCKNCGQIGYYHAELQKAKCHSYTCKNARVDAVLTSHCVKVLIQELQSMGIKVIICLDDELPIEVARNLKQMQEITFPNKQK